MQLDTSANQPSLPEDWINNPYPPGADFWGRLDEGGEAETYHDLLHILCYICTPRERDSLAAASIILPVDPDLRPQPWTPRAVLTKHWEQRRLKFHHEEVEFGKKSLGIEKSEINGTLKGNRWLLIPWSPEAVHALRATVRKPNRRKDDRPSGLVLEHVTPIDTLWSYLVSRWEAQVEQVKVELSENPLQNQMETWKHAVGSWVLGCSVYLRRNYVLAIITKGQDKALGELGFKTEGSLPGAPFARYFMAGVKWTKTTPASRPKTPPPNPFAFIYPDSSEWAFLSSATIASLDDEVESDEITGSME